MGLYQVSSRDLDGWIAEQLQPSKKFRQNVQDDIHRICAFLKERCSMDVSVIKTVKGGSAGKGTALDDNSDADLVTFLDCFSSFNDQKEKRALIIKTIETELKRCQKSIAYKVEIPPSNVDDSLRRALKLKITSTKKKEPVEVDILPAYDALGQVTSTYKPSSMVYINLIKTKGLPGEFNTSFTELQRNFVKCCPGKFKNLLRLVKHWYKEYKECLRKVDPSSSLPPKFALELLTIYAWEEGTGRAEKFDTAEGFCTVMKLLCRHQDLCFYWTKYYDLEHPIIGAHVKEQLKGQRPVVMDPADPTGNVGKGKGWDLLAKEALKCLGQSCCQKGTEPVQPWKVQPARAINLTVKLLTGESWIVPCSPYVAIWQIKMEIEKKNSISAYVQSLALPESNTALQDEKTLADYGVFCDTTILSLHTKLQEIEIFVKDLNSRTSVYTISTSSTVLDLKKKIEGRTRIPVNQQHLIYNEKELEDGKKLTYYSIRSKDSVHLVLRLRGGLNLF
ncbi:2'-5'-oligoadenylate synthase 1-like [Tiliqua scincoides]|uniref:2'-5'-oligoadenylate synthase 1-like n=1 Tax=Tiliqua scincoides TaxID=71010 RepID=UPI003461CDAD